ncbi:hypothetical protein BDQ17DRAFT_1440948 [Cyathus striatus]|nr:hypothetical protein BDQ17DRAFT_1440948 [Cyathus striatus]
MAGGSDDEPPDMIRIRGRMQQYNNTNEAESTNSTESTASRKKGFKDLVRSINPRSTSPKAGDKRKATEKSPQEQRAKKGHKEIVLETTSSTAFQIDDDDPMSELTEDLQFNDMATFDQYSASGKGNITLSRREITHNIATGLQNVLNMITLARNAGQDNVMDALEITNLLNVITDNLNMKIQDQILNLMKTMSGIERKIDGIKDRVENNIKNKLGNIQETIEEKEKRILKCIEWLEETIQNKNNNAQTTDSKISQTTTPTQSLHTSKIPVTSQLGPQATTPNQYLSKVEHKKNNQAPLNPTAAYHPSRAVLVYKNGIPPEQRLKPEEICDHINKALKRNERTNELQVIAEKYTQHRNIIVNTKANQKATELVKHADKVLPLLHPDIPAIARADMKWWKIQIDRVPTHKLTAMGEVFIHDKDDVHKELKDCNPAYMDISKQSLTPLVASKHLMN